MRRMRRRAVHGCEGGEPVSAAVPFRSSSYLKYAPCRSRSLRVKRKRQCPVAQHPPISVRKFSFAGQEHERACDAQVLEPRPAAHDAAAFTRACARGPRGELFAAPREKGLQIFSAITVGHRHHRSEEGVQMNLLQHNLVNAPVGLHA